MQSIPPWTPVRIDINAVTTDYRAHPMGAVGTHSVRVEQSDEETVPINGSRTVILTAHYYTGKRTMHRAINTLLGSSRKLAGEAGCDRKATG